MPATAQALRTTDDYRRRLARLSDAVQAQAKDAWRLMSWDDLRGSYERVMSRIEPLVRQAQVDAVRLTSAYLAAYLTAETGQDTMPPILVRERYVGFSYGGQPLQYSLRSPLVVVLSANKRRDEDPLGQGLKALLVNIDLDVKNAARTALLDGIQADHRIVGWQRAVGGTCVACLAEAAGLSHGLWFPVHPNCQCVPEPVVDAAVMTARGGRSVVLNAAAEKRQRALERYDAEKPKGVRITDRRSLAADYLAEYYDLPQDLRTALDAYPKCVNLSSKSVTYAYPVFRGKRGATPRGWPSRYTYDDCPGFYHRGGPIADHRVYLGMGMEHRYGSVSHEVGHMIDEHLRLRSDPVEAERHLTQLRKWHEIMYASDGLDPYLAQGGPGGDAGMREFFAESMSTYMANGYDAAVKRYGKPYVAWLEKQVADFVEISRDAAEVAKWKPQRAKVAA